ncbi:hypothetical protein B0T14DRAFT_561392 [Immersiella caudata]|uniref:Uncharacterized protein n=1 Tax=Immersiella caudata TaxID=314043 RepID=A0AA39XIB4_9PEZI|nr:hypothetical protein B0T14DRAFT_561392 [Immersiella caudata]
MCPFFYILLHCLWVCTCLETVRFLTFSILGIDDPFLKQLEDHPEITLLNFIVCIFVLATAIEANWNEQWANIWDWLRGIGMWQGEDQGWMRDFFVNDGVDDESDVEDDADE